MKILNKKWIKWAIIPLLLLLIWVGFSIYSIGKSPGLNILQYSYDRESFKSFKDSELLKNESVSAEFKSQANNLGIVAVRFNTYSRINNDELIFRIKYKGDKEWFYTGSYLVNQFQPNGLFTFGFPLISNSQDKTYLFEIQSIKGKQDNAVAISPFNPIFVTKHEYSKGALTSNANTFQDFTYKKIINLATSTEFLISSLTYLYPLVFYLAYIMHFGKKVKIKNISKHRTNLLAFFKFQIEKYKIALLPLLFIILNSVLVSKVSHTIIVLIMTTWIFILKKFKLDSRTSFALSVMLLSMCPMLLILKLDNIAEKAALWAYMFLFTGTIHQIIETVRIKPMRELKNLD